VIRTIVAALLFATISTSVAAQAPASPEPGSELTVYLLTMGPGDQVWEKFGHNAIWIHDESNHTDIAYHWGLFDFADKDFYPNFIKGRMRYSMGAFDMNETVDQYRRTNRTVWAQKLNLSAAQKEKLAEFISWNLRPENRFYRYDYFRDNCSTRVRDAIDGALGGPIKAATDTASSHSTYRFHTSRLTQDDWPVFTGTMMGLGEPTDRDISIWEEMFLPVRMKERLKSVRVPTTNGMQPLVLDETVLVQATRAPEESIVHRGIFGYLLIAVVILALGYGLWVLGGKGQRVGLVLSLAALWSFIAGLAGTLLAGLWGLTDHLYSYRNENLLQLNPLSLVLTVLLIGFAVRARRRPGSTPSRSAMRWARIVAGLAVIGFVAQLLPALDQVNGDVIALALPLHLGVLALLFGIEARNTPVSEPV
jgi:hypothetical protein